jgi:hypothetical protein
LPACGAILDFPNTQEDDNYPSGDGSNDGQTLGDGELPSDARPPGDGSVLPDAAIPDSGPQTFCDGGKACFGGACSSTGACEPYPLTTASALGATYLAYDSGYVYFTSGTDKIYRVDANQNLSAPLVSGEENLSALVIANGLLFFANAGDGASMLTGKISSCPLDGCATGRVDYLTGSKHIVQSLAVTTGGIYYADNEATGSGGTGGIHTCTLSAGGCNATSATVSIANANDLQAYGNSFYWLSGTNGVYLCQQASCTSANGTANVGPVDFAVGSGGIYPIYTSGLYHETTTGSSAVQWISSLPKTDVAVVTDDTDIYWLDIQSTQGDVVKCSIATDCPAGTPTTIATSLNEPHHLVLSSDSIYFTTDDGVFRLAK